MNYFLIHKKNKKAQLTLFIIISLLIVVFIIFLFLIRTKTKTEIVKEKEPISFINLCIKDSIKDAIEKISKRGGEINPVSDVYYKGINVSYLCYNYNPYYPCINQKGDLIKNVEKEIKNFVYLRIENCFEILKKEYELNYKVSMEEMNLTIKINPNEVVGEIKRRFIIENEEKRIEYEKFKGKVESDLYNLLIIAMEVSNQESTYCNFNNLGFMMIYPKYEITKERIAYSGNIGYTIYTIKNKERNEEFIFAIRSCKMPPGF